MTAVKTDDGTQRAQKYDQVSRTAAAGNMVRLWSERTNEQTASPASRVIRMWQLEFAWNSFTLSYTQL